MTQVLISDTCQYIPIIDTIRFLFSSGKMQNLYMESTKSIDGKMQTNAMVHSLLIIRDIQMPYRYNFILMM